MAESRCFYDERGNEIDDRHKQNRHTRENTYSREDSHHGRGYRNQRVRPRYDRGGWDTYVYPRHPRGRGDYYTHDMYRNDFNYRDCRNQRGYYHYRNHNYTNFDRRTVSGNSWEDQHRPERERVSTGNWGGYPDELGWGNYPKEYSWEKKSFDRKRNNSSYHDQAGPAQGLTLRNGCKAKSQEESKDTHKDTITDNIDTKTNAISEASAQVCKTIQTAKCDKTDSDASLKTCNPDESVQETAVLEKLMSTLEVFSNSSEELSKSDTAVEVDVGMLIKLRSTSSSISLAWSFQKQNIPDLSSYEIKYRECNNKNSKWISAVTNDETCTWTIQDLLGGTDYEFKIRPLNENGDEGPFSRPPVKMSTSLSLASQLILDAENISDGSPSVYKLPLKIPTEAANFAVKTRKCILGQRTASFSQEKTILLVGATGSGKTTLINAMVNYITNVAWDDTFRFTIIDLTDDEKMKEDKQEQSQTEWISCYTVHQMNGSNINYSINIIDTPGFGDTRGITRDKAIVDQMRTFFTTPGELGISVIDAVCFVTQAPLARLTPPQKYIFHSILSIFGQDIASNIFVLVTFADGKAPPVLAALEAANVPYNKYFMFNNSALFSNPQNDKEAIFGKLFWKMGQENLRVFFEELLMADSRSLQLTAEVLDTRQRLEATVQGLKLRLDEGLNKLNTIRQEEEILEKHKTDIENNRNFTYTVDEIRMEKESLPPRQYVTNCLTCNSTCHFPCHVRDDEKKHKCSVMYDNYCTVCSNRCHWKMHVNNDFRIISYSVQVEKTYENLKEKYKLAKEQEKKQRSTLDRVKCAFSFLSKSVMVIINDVRIHINKLSKIALRQDPLSDVEYIDILIENEKTERKNGWQNRCKLFCKFRDEAELIAKTSDQNFMPFGENLNP
ncbi:uncharacterized protein LOC127738140 isoform X2 [Mytilus californianus]|uniref:uncharacterized protein LOC127738140 isoform X2 n=1 Tax=Mytilus californianus TaxID=6549 RepID=UPI002245B449|nr:uncharacterized protein LOC127738140 isoform X2 [Mytilus californianus]XP_052105238.1 uncharacterized protein LOC127738140 isoform X2 [Mytilus californianus]